MGETFLDRLKQERQELVQKIEKLDAFMGSDAYQKIDPFQMTLLNIQHHAMLTYSQVLLERLTHLQGQLEGEAVASN